MQDAKDGVTGSDDNGISYMADVPDTVTARLNAGNPQAQTATVCSADTDANGQVDVQDLLNLLSKFNSSGANVGTSDVNGDTGKRTATHF